MNKVEETTLGCMIDNIKDVINEVQEYIESTKHYIFYWYSSVEVRDFIEEYVDDYEERISLEIVNVYDFGAEVKIRFDGGDTKYIHRYASLRDFRNEVKNAYEQYGGKINNLRIKELERDLELYEQYADECRRKINELKQEK